MAIDPGLLQGFVDNGAADLGGAALGGLADAAAPLTGGISLLAPLLLGGSGLLGGNKQSQNQDQTQNQSQQQTANASSNASANSSAYNNLTINYPNQSAGMALQGLLGNPGLAQPVSRTSGRRRQHSQLRLPPWLQRAGCSRHTSR